MRLMTESEDADPLLPLLMMLLKQVPVQATGLTAIQALPRGTTLMAGIGLPAGTEAAQGTGMI